MWCAHSRISQQCACGSCTRIGVCVCVESIEACRQLSFCACKGLWRCSESSGIAIFTGRPASQLQHPTVGALLVRAAEPLLSGCMLIRTYDTEVQMQLGRPLHCALHSVHQHMDCGYMQLKHVNVMVEYRVE